MPEIITNVQNRQPHRSEEVVIDFQPQSTENISALGQTADTSQNGGLSTLTVTNPDNAVAGSIALPFATQDFNMIESVINESMNYVIKCNVLTMMTGITTLLIFQLNCSYLYLLICIWLYYTYNIATSVYNRQTLTL